MLEKQIAITYQEFLSLDELNEQDNNLCLASKKALLNAHAPYSEFKVGAALLLESGKIVYGSNQENVAYPSGLCAERVAFFSAAANYPDDKILSVAITAHTEKFEINSAITPCGGCLQVMVEYEKKQNSDIKVILFAAKSNVVMLKNVKSLLPFLFFESRLKK